VFIRWSLGALPLAMLIVGCSSSVAVTRTYTPEDAARRDPRLTPVAVIRGEEPMSVPPNAHVEEDRVAWPNDPGEHVLKLRRGDVIEADGEGRIVAVRSGESPSAVTRFVVGSAVSPDGSNEVRGRLQDNETVIPLKPGDRILMKGSFAPDESVPGGGYVATSRSTGALAAGIAFTLLSYGPSVYVGATSKLKADHALLAPVAGPWIDLATRPKCVPPPGSQILPVSPCIFETVSQVGLVAGGVVEALGAALIAVGLPSKSRVAYDQDHGVGWTLVPHVGPGTGSVTAVGRF
jgi:hypothetical protein